MVLLNLEQIIVTLSSFCCLRLRVSEEKFMEPAKNWLSNLKLRFSYGLTGNSDIGQYRSLPMLGSTNYVFGGNRAPGIVIGELANPDLKWEKLHNMI